MILYHGGTDIVKEPMIISAEQGRDFGFGFYTTDIYEQAAKWAKRQGRIRKKQAVLNIYEFDSGKAAEELKFKEFVEYSIEWLEFIVNNRANPSFQHSFDIVFGKIANDDVGETVQAVVDGLMPLDFALKKLSFMRANNQYAFCSEKSLSSVIFTDFQKVE
jgi:elongation factor P hydroxylase